MLSHAGSGFLTYEDAVNYQMIWAKEFYQTNYIGQSLSIVQCIIDLTNNFVYGAIAQPMTIFKLNIRDGSFVTIKVLYNSGAYCSSTSILNSLLYSQSISTLLIYFSDANQYDYVLQISSVDLQSSPYSYQILDGKKNAVTRKVMKASVNKSSPLVYAENNGWVLESGVWKAAIYVIFVLSPPVLIQQVTTTFSGTIAASQILLDTGVGNVRIGCIHDVTELNNGAATSAGIYFQSELVSPASYAYYQLYSGIVSPSSILCRDAQITDTYRQFLFFENYDSTLPAASSKYMSILELTLLPSYQLQVTKTILQSYQGTLSACSFFYVYPGSASGTYFSIYSINSKEIQGQTAKTVNIGYLMKSDLGTTQGAVPVLPSLTCGLTPTSGTTLTLALTNVNWVSVANTLTPLSYTLGSDSSSLVSLQSQDIPQYQIETSGCSGPAITIPKYLPYINDVIYYVIGLDTLVSSGIKTFPLTVNASMTSLTPCQLDALAYEITMKNGLALPRFVSLNRASLSIIVNNPIVGAMPTEVGTFLLQILMRDIFGDSQALDVTLIVVQEVTTPSGIANCYTETTVLYQGLAFDTLYVIGSLKYTKYQMNVPRTISQISCEQMLVMNAVWVLPGGIVSRLPYFMSQDTSNRQLVTFLPQVQGLNYIGQTFTIQVTSYIMGHEYLSKTFSFNVHIIYQQTFIGCPYYYTIVAPAIPDQVFYSSMPSTSIQFNKFAMSDTTCDTQVSISSSAMQTNGISLPTCISINSGILTVNPGMCGGPLPLTFEVRLDGWIQDLSYGIRTLQTFTQFTVSIVSPTTCIGQLILQISNSPTYYEFEYTNADSPTPISNQYLDSLFVNPSTQYPVSPSSISCDSAHQYLIEGLYYDNGFVAPSFISQPITTQHSYSVTSVTEVNVGIYDIRMIGRYYEADMLTIYPNILPATVFLNYQIYSASACQISIGNQPNSFQYQMSSIGLPSSLYFNQFLILTDGCIYDKIEYEFSTLGSGSLPSFVTQNQGNISITVQTSNNLFAGTYSMQLAGSLNPNLVQIHTFTISLLSYTQKSPGAPTFHGSVQSPQVVTLGTPQTYILPSVKIVTGDTITLSVLYTSAAGSTSTLPNFITFDTKKNAFYMNPTNQSDVGSYSLQVVLTDANASPKSSTYPLIVQVQLYNEAVFQALLDKFKSSMKSQYIGVMVEGINSDAVLTIAFNVSLFNASAGPQQFNNQSLTIQMKQALSAKTYNLNWTVQNITNDKLYIKLNFSDPQAISLYSQKDSLIVKFNKGSQLLASEPNTTAMALAYLGSIGNENQSVSIGNLDFSNLQYKMNQNFILSNVIPQQGSKDSTMNSLLASNQGYIQGSVNSIMFGNLALNILMSSSIQMLWGTINTLQLILIATMFNISFPQSTLFLFTILSQITNFNLIPVSHYVSQIFTFTYNGPLSDNFNEMGYNSCNILQNLNSSLLFILGIGAVMIITIVADILLINSKYRARFQKVYNAVFFSVTIRILLECYIEMTLSATLNIFIFNFQLLGDKVSAVFTVLVSAIDFLMPITILIFVVSTKSRVSDPQFIAKYGSLYEGLKLIKVMHMLCNFFFTLRRLLLILAAVQFINYPSFQVMLFIFMSLLSIMYLIHQRPYENPSTNANEIFNEACVLSVSYMLLIFTDFVPSPQVKQYAGYGLIGTIIGNFGINLILQLFSSLRTLPRACQKLKRSNICRKKVQLEILEVFESVQTQGSPSQRRVGDGYRGGAIYFQKDKSNVVKGVYTSRFASSPQAKTMERSLSSNDVNLNIRHSPKKYQGNQLNFTEAFGETALSKSLKSTQTTPIAKPEYNQLASHLDHFAYNL